MTLIFRHLLRSGEGKWEEVFSTTTYKTIQNIHKANIVSSFSYPCLSSSIKSEHGSLVSQGSNINVKEIHTDPHITWIWNSQKYLFQYRSWNFFFFFRRYNFREVLAFSTSFFHFVRFLMQSFQFVIFFFRPCYIALYIILPSSRITCWKSLSSACWVESWVEPRAGVEVLERNSHLHCRASKSGWFNP